MDASTIVLALIAASLLISPFAYDAWLSRRLHHLSGEHKAAKDDLASIRAETERACALMAKLGEPLIASLGGVRPEEKDALARLIPLGLERAENVAVWDHERRQSLVRMRQIWCDESIDERACHDLLFDNLWVLEPDYCLESPAAKELSLARLMEQFFGGKDEAWARGFQHDPREAITPDIFACVRTTHSLHAYNPDNAAERTLLIIELKRPGKKIGHAAMDQAFTYACDTLKLIPPEKCQQIECLVVGGDIEEGQNTISLFWDETRPRWVNVVPLTYDDLIKRGERLLAGIEVYCSRDNEADRCEVT